MKALSRLTIALFAGLFAGVAGAGEADVVSARAHCTPARICAFQVTVQHADEGWDHFANRFEVLDPAGAVLAVRELRHPHVDEQPFTRVLRGARIPSEIERVRVRVHDSVHGYGGAEIQIDLPSAEPEAPASAP